MQKPTDVQEAIMKWVSYGRDSYDGSRARRFYGDEAGDSLECSEYLEGLSSEFAPFNCPNLRVLLENIEIIKEEGPQQGMKKESLFALN